MSTDAHENDEQRARLTRALIALKDLRSQLDELRRAQAEPIAIVGLGCRFPGGADDPDGFWRLLRNQEDAIREVPPERWDVDAYYAADPEAAGKICTRYGGFLDAVDQFDAHFFGIAPREAASLDPQQRLLLEVAWEALEHAGLAADRLRGSRTGVFAGISSNEYVHLLLSGGPERIDSYMGSGNAHSVAAGRLSYVFGFEGPSLAVDTACSSSLVTVHLACQSLRLGECDLALAGGVNVLLTPTISINHSRARMLAPDGRCKTFDAAADGFVRSEGCGLVVLKRLSAALVDGDPMLAVIRGSAVNQDGHTSGLTVPNGPSQQAVIRQALARAGLAPAEVSYVEAHGTGTALGDPIELHALAAVFGGERPAERPLVVGSVKTNIGHAEAAAGIAGLIKVVLALRHETIPANLHFHRPNPRVAWDQSPVTVPSAALPWPKGPEPRVAGVSSFGFGGTNAHVVVADPPAPAPRPTAPPRPLHLLALSAQSDEALKALATRYATHLVEPPEQALGDVCHTVNAGRAHFRHRLGVAAGSVAELRTRLGAFAAGAETAGLTEGEADPARPPLVAFLFTGQGAQYAGMGRELYETQPGFRRHLGLCDELLRPYQDRRLLEVLDAADGALDETAYTQPALFALEYCLGRLWMSWGVVPDFLLGHSLGEYVAACLAGVFSLDDGIRLIATRARLMQKLPGDGAMAAVFAGEAEVRSALAALAPDLDVAAINGPEHVVVSGRQAGLDRVIEHFARQGLETRALKVSQAFHSALLEPMLEELERVAGEVSFSPPRLEIVSNLTGALAGAELAEPGYWRRHARQPVRFCDGMRTLEEQGVSVFLEVGPHPVLLGMGRRCVSRREPIWLASLRRGQGEWQVMLDTLAALYVRGVPVDWRGFDAGYGRRRVRLPTYPFQRQRYWVAPEGAGGASLRLPVSGQLDDAGEVLAEVAGLEARPADAASLRPEGLALYQLRWLPQPRAAASADFLPSPGTIAAALGPDEQSYAGLVIAYNVLHATVSPRETMAHVHRLLAPGAARQALVVARKAGNEPPQAADRKQTWLILADAGGFGEELAGLLEARGHRAVRAYRGAAFAQTSEDVFALDPVGQEDSRRLLAELSGTDAGGAPLHAILHLWGLDSAATEGWTAADLMADSVALSGSAVRLAQALAAAGLEQPPALWLVTRGALPVGEMSRPPALKEAALWGTGKVIAREYPGFWGGMLDLDPTAPPGEGTRLLDELCFPDGEDHLAFRGGERYAARIVPCDPVPEHAVPVRGDGTYLITGGLGALGLETARWLVEQGARRLALVGRNGAATDAARQAVAELERRGAKVDVFRADVADETAMGRVFTALRAAGLSLRGVVHAAGIPGRRAIAELEPADLDRMFAAKVAGAWVLHQLAREWDLDFFACFSSMVSLWGAKEQCHYVAANHVLDLLVHYRRALGLPALAVNWGPLQGGGMLAPEDAAELKRIGVTATPMGRSVRALADLLGSEVAQAAPVDIDWPLYRSVYQSRGRCRLFDLVAGGAAADARPEPPAEAGIRECLGGAPESERREILAAHVRAVLGRVLGLEVGRLPDRQQGFFDMGMDSLTAMELRTKLQASLAVSLPATLAFDYGTVDTLADYLLRDHLDPVPSAPAADAREAGGQGESSREMIELMSDDEVEILLQAKLSSL